MCCGPRGLDGRLGSGDVAETASHPERSTDQIGMWRSFFEIRPQIVSGDFARAPGQNADDLNRVSRPPAVTTLHAGNAAVPTSFAVSKLEF